MWGSVEIDGFEGWSTIRGTLIEVQFEVTFRFLITWMHRDFGKEGKRLNVRFDFDKISLFTFFLGKKVKPSTVVETGPKKEKNKIILELKREECCPFLCSSKEMDERKDAEIERTSSFSARVPKFSARQEHRSIRVKLNLCLNLNARSFAHTQRPTISGAFAQMQKQSS